MRTNRFRRKKRRSRARGRLDWLKADLGYWTKQVENAGADRKKTIKQTLEEWKVDPALAGIRDPAAVNKLRKTSRRRGAGFGKTWKGC